MVDVSQTIIYVAYLEYGNICTCFQFHFPMLFPSAASQNEFQIISHLYQGLVLLTQGSYGSGKSQWDIIFLKVMEESGNFEKSQWVLIFQANSKEIRFVILEHVDYYRCSGYV